MALDYPASLTSLNTLIYRLYTPYLSTCHSINQDNFQCKILSAYLPNLDTTLPRQITCLSLTTLLINLHHNFHFTHTDNNNTINIPINVINTSNLCCSEFTNTTNFESFDSLPMAITLEPLAPEHIYDVTQSLIDAPARTISSSTLRRRLCKILQIANSMRLIMAGSSLSSREGTSRLAVVTASERQSHCVLERRVSGVFS